LVKKRCAIKIKSMSDEKATAMLNALWFAVSFGFSGRFRFDLSSPAAYLYCHLLNIIVPHKKY
jgi:hypothetical protein